MIVRYVIWDNLRQVKNMDEIWAVDMQFKGSVCDDIMGSPNMHVKDRVM